MNIEGEGEAPVEDFAAFEAAATADEPEAKEPEAKGPDDAGEGERTDEDEPDDKVNDKAEDGDDEEGEDKPEKRRSKPAHQRIGELTAKLRQAERERDEALGRKPEPAAEQAPLTKPDPNAKNEDGTDKYEFGEADPEYAADLMDWKVEAKLAERDKAKADEAVRETQAATLKAIDDAWEEKAAKGAEKYDDFQAVVLDGAAAGDWDCPPLMAAAISQSDVGADVAYHLAKNPEIAESIAAQLSVNPMVAAEQFGFIEGGFMDTKPAKPTGSHPLDIAIHAGRLRAFLDKKPAGKFATSAPEPAKERARGGSGQFTVGGDTSDFAAFERIANKKAAG